MDFFNAADEFKKCPQLKEEDLNHLREWISKQPHLPHVDGEWTTITKINFKYPQFHHVGFYSIV